MTDKIELNLENCYGIREFNETLTFEQNKPITIYAPNGVMKTSLAKTFTDLSKGLDSVDRIHTDRETKRKIRYNDEEPNAQSILVIEPFNDTYRSEKVSTLLVNAALRSEFEDLHQSLDNNISALLSNIEDRFSKKIDSAAAILTSIKTPQNNIISSLARIEREVEDNTDNSLSHFKFDDLFSDRVEKFFSNPNIQKDVQDYITRYDELLAASKYFKGGVFNHNNADTIAKTLVSNGWFAGGHTITLKSEEDNQEVNDEKELQSVIQHELDSILTDKDLSKKFEKIDKPLNANQEIRDFRNFLWKNQTLISQYSDIKTFKEKVIISYLSCKRLDLI